MYKIVDFLHKLLYRLVGTEKCLKLEFLGNLVADFRTILMPNILID